MVASAIGLLSRWRWRCRLTDTTAVVGLRQHDDPDSVGASSRGLVSVAVALRWRGFPGRARELSPLFQMAR